MPVLLKDGRSYVRQCFAPRGRIQVVLYKISGVQKSFLPDDKRIFEEIDFA